MITKLHVQNFKCLRDVSVELRPFTVLIGKNDTGKSSFLEAIHTLGGLVQAKPQRTSAPVDKLAWRGAEPPCLQWEAEVAATARNRLPGAATYTLRVLPSAKDPGGIYVDSEGLSVEGTKIDAGIHNFSGARILNLSEGKTNVRRELGDGPETALSLAGLEQGLPTIKAVARALQTSPIFRLDAERLARPAAYDAALSDGDREPMLTQDGYGLPVLLDWILGASRPTFDAIEQELRAAVPYVKSIRLKQARLNGTVGKSIAFELIAGGHEIAASLASQGVMLFLAYLALTHLTDPPAVILIEEPENGIHPRTLQRVVEYLKRLTDPARGANAVQIVTATHSPYFLDFVAPEDVLVFGRKESGETIVRPLLELPGVKQRLEGGFSLGEMWFNVGEDRLLAEALA